MDVELKSISAADMALVLEMMAEFYRDQRMRFDAEGAISGLRQMLADPARGGAYLVLCDRSTAGYLFLTSCFSVELHGEFMLLDELYLRPAFRGKGVGSVAVVFAERVCRERGVKTLRLEVGYENAPAQSLYERMGFKRETRHLLTKLL
jgi:GNAT superfamily N-acetyltransferase